MRPLAILRALGVCAVSLGATGVSDAGLPPPNNSIIPSIIRLVGHDGQGHADPAGLFTVIVRDIANNPVAGSNVVVEITGTDVKLGTVQQPGVTVVCSLGAYAFTDATGSVQMSLIGAARPGPPANQMARIYADGVLLGYVRVAMFDLDGGNGVRGSDLSIWSGDFLSGTDPARSDYDGSGYIGGSDLSIWADVFLRGKSVEGAAYLGPVCP